MVVHGAREVMIREAGDVVTDPLVLGPARGTQRAEIIVQNSVELAGFTPSPVNTCIQIRSPIRMWFSVPWMEPKKAPRSARY